jgi:hypothetical protein
MLDLVLDLTSVREYTRLHYASFATGVTLLKKLFGTEDTPLA